MMKISKQMRKLNDDVWKSLKIHTLFFECKESVLRSILKQEQIDLYHNATFYYSGEELTLNLSKFMKNINLSLGNTPLNAQGWYDFNRKIIILNEHYFSAKQKENLGYKAYYMMMHELRHSVQYCLIENKDSIHDKNDNLVKCINYMEAYIANKCSIKQFGFDDVCSLHINPYYEGKEIPKECQNELTDDLSTMFYSFNYLEYDAFSFQESSGDESLSYYYNYYMNVFNERYHYYDYEYDENDIVYEINESILHVYENTKPDSYLQASIMYDLCCIALLQSNSITEEECIKLLSDEEKNRWINIENYVFQDNQKYVNEQTICESNFYIYTTSPEKFHSLSDDELRNNPKLVLYMVAFGSDIHSSLSDGLRKYCCEHADELYQNQIYINGAKVLFGEDFWNEILNVDIEESEQELEVHEESNGEYKEYEDDCEYDEFQSPDGYEEEDMEW